jgi:adenosine 3'-phospho 5'-phosphosulfate transporter B3
MKEDSFPRQRRSSDEGSTTCSDTTGDVVLWGFRITCLSPQQQLCVLGVAMFFCHVLQGILTEYVAKGVLSGLMWAAAAIELSVYSVLSGVELKMTHAAFDVRTIPWRSYLSIAACISVGRGLTWVGYGTLSYPTVLLFKSSKILVVMLTGSIILGKRFAPTEYCAALLAMAGLYLFSVADMVSVSDRTDSIKGIGLMLLAVGSEATVSNMQVLFL